MREKARTGALALCLLSAVLLALSLVLASALATARAKLESCQFLLAAELEPELPGKAK